MLEILNSVIVFILVVLSVWRVSSLFAYESGPFSIFGSIRYYLKKNSNNVVLYTLHEGISCLWCNSIWFSALASILITNNIASWIVYTLSISTCSILIEERLIGDR